MAKQKKTNSKSTPAGVIFTGKCWTVNGREFNSRLKAEIYFKKTQGRMASDESPVPVPGDTELRINH